MPFIIFLILVLLIVNGLSIFKFIYRLALFFIMLTIVGLTSYFIFSFSQSDQLSDLEASVPAKLRELHEHAQEGQLQHEIKKLRIEIKSCKSIAEKNILTKHLQRLEALQIQKQNEERAIKDLEQDKKKLKELQKLQNSLEQRKTKFKKDAKRLEDLQKQIKRSEKIIEKLNELDNPKKGIKHD